MTYGAYSVFILIYILQDNLFYGFNRTLLLYRLCLKVFGLYQIAGAIAGGTLVFIECLERVHCPLLLNHCLGDVRVVIDELGPCRFLDQILLLSRCEFLSRDDKQIGLWLEKLRRVNVDSTGILLV